MMNTYISVKYLEPIIIYIYMLLVNVSYTFVNLQIRRKYTVQWVKWSFGAMNCELTWQTQLMVSHLVKKYLTI